MLGLHSGWQSLSAWDLSRSNARQPSARESKSKSLSYNHVQQPSTLFNFPNAQYLRSIFLNTFAARVLPHRNSSMRFSTGRFIQGIQPLCGDCRRWQNHWRVFHCVCRAGTRIAVGVERGEYVDPCAFDAEGGSGEVCTQLSGINVFWLISL